LRETEVGKGDGSEDGKKDDTCCIDGGICVMKEGDVFWDVNILMLRYDEDYRWAFASPA
jgi:hypothetical protein